MNYSKKFTQFIVQRPWTSILIGLLTLFIFLPGLSNLEQDFSYRIWFRDSEPLIKRYDNFQAKFGNDDLINIIIHSPNGIFDKESIDLIQELTDELWKVSDVISVDSLTNYQWTSAHEDELIIEDFISNDHSAQTLKLKKEMALADKTLPDYLINREATVTNIYAKIKPHFDGAPNDKEIIAQTREMISRIKQKLPSNDDHTIHTNGSLDINNTFREVSEHDVATIFPIVFLIIILFLTYIFRNITLVLLPLLTILVTIMATFGLAGYLGIKFNNLIAMVPTILIAIAIADSVHLLVTYFQFRKSGNNSKEATTLSITKNFKPTILTTISTAIGFFSCTTSDLIPLRDLGILAGAGTILAWIFTMFLMCPILLKSKVKGIKENNQDDVDPRAMERARSIVNTLDKYKYPIAFITLLVSIFSTYLGLKNEVNSNPYTYFTENVPLRISNDFTLKNLGGFYGPQVVIDSGVNDGIKDPAFLKKVESFQSWLEEKEYISRVTSIVEVIKAMNKSMHGDDESYYRVPENRKTIAELLFLYTMSLPQGKDLNDRMSIEKDSLRMAVLWTLQGSKESLEKMALIESKAKEFGLDAQVTGKIPIYQNMTTFVVKSFFSSIALALVGISLLLIIIFKSIKLGVFSMLPNIIPLMVGAGLMKILSTPIDVGTALVSSVCLGIVVDDTIHFLNSFNALRSKGMATKEALVKVLATTGPALIWTTLILAVGFGALIFANFSPNKNFGIFTALVLLVALVVDLIILPTLLLMRKR
ncbi:putative integral membrane protein [Halobacteriovorax marinus SJ]|uniref:Integral membrane protein n=1 Tax=Halobacteriovorax marinus (strain ATCC BAA-682 / DSM 15412 / SJ) TaxID=862908 RepID=E1WXT2_HALMS|nr:MMPL family transporter [Halobacteriovorax marinus]CBW25889.1 putative integral membrane protein [Halobacteriovorax marinus SJ]